MDYQPLIESLPATTLAILTSLIASQHVLLQSSPQSTTAAISQLERAAAATFGISCAVVHCSPSTTIADFSNAIIIESESPPPNGSDEPPALDDRKLAGLIVAAGLNTAPRHVQLLALDLMHTRRITTRTAVHIAPARFCVVAIVAPTSTGAWPLFRTRHLNDHFWISHVHDAEDDKLDTASPPRTPSPGSTHSVVHKLPGVLPAFSAAALDDLVQRVGAVNATAEIRRYTHDIPTFLRMHRAVAGGVSAYSPRHLAELSKIMAVLNGIRYVTPSLVDAAARRVYAHRLHICDAENERSMQWGSEVGAVAKLLEGVTSESIIDEVLESVPSPL